MRHRAAIWFAVTGDRRFLSHRDMLRLFERAIHRANLPIRFSAGYNPRPRLWLLLPRSVGVASDDELLVIELERSESPAHVFRRLASELPEGVTLVRARGLPDESRPRPVEVTYRLDLAGDPDEALGQAVRRLMAADRLEVRRRSKKSAPPRHVDVRGWIARVELTCDALTVILRVSPEGSARPAEVLELLGLDPVETMPRLRRVSVRWENLSSEADALTDSS